MLSLASSVAFAQVVAVPASSALPGVVPVGDAEGFCAQFTKGSTDVPGNAHIMDTIEKSIGLLDGTSVAPKRHAPDLTFFAILPTVNLHDAANEETTREVGNDQLFPWSKPVPFWSNEVCESHGGAGVADGERIAMRLQGNLHVRQSGIKTFAVRADDGYRLTIGGKKIVEYDGLRAARVDTARVNFAQAGIYPIEVVYYENTDAAVLEMFVADSQISFTGDTDGSIAPGTVGNVVVSANPATGSDLTYVTLATLPVGFRLLSYEDVGLPTWEPTVKPAGYTNCQELVGEPSDICVIDEPSMTCGNGAIDVLPGNRVEGCDDGNTDDGDGCSATCGVEPGWTCVGQPSTCFLDADGDGIPDEVDNCPTIANADQVDSNSSGFGDACDVLITHPADGAMLGTADVVVSGTTTPNTVVTIWDGGVQVGTVTSNGSGVWSFTLVDLDDGGYQIEATATVAGKAVRDEVSFTVNSENFIVIVGPADGATVETATPTLSGTTVPGAVVTVKVDGAVVGTTTADAAGNWSFAVPDALADGAHTVQVETTNAGGVKASAASGFVVDTTVDDSALVITSPQDGDKVTTSTPTITGTTEPGVTVTVRIDGVVVGTVVADANGDWSLPLGDALADGAHTVHAEAEIAGETVETSAGFIVGQPGGQDSTVTITSPTEGQVVTTTTPTITGTAPAGSVVTVWVDGVDLGTAVADENGNWSFVIPNPVTPSSHLVEVQTEIDGEIHEASVTFEVKMDGPELVISSPADGGSIYGDAPVEVTGTATPGSKIDIYVDGELIVSTGADDDGNWSAEIPGMEPGQVEIEVIASDDDGNQTSRTIDVEVFEFIPGVNPDGTLTGGGMLCSAAPGQAGGGLGLGGVVLMLLGAGVLFRRRQA